MKIATYNVNGVNGRIDVLLRWLDEASPDVVCLQELTTPDAGFPLMQIEKAEYGAIWQGQKSWNGVAILARDNEPILTRKGLPGDPEVRDAYRQLVDQGWTDAMRKLNPDARTRFGTMSGMPTAGTRACGSLIFYSALPWPSGFAAPASISTFADGNTPAITLRCGLSFSKIKDGQTLETPMSEKLRATIRERIEDFVDSFVVDGSKPADVFDAMEAEIAALRKAYDRDPAPADEDSAQETLEEPSNDWPGADEKIQSGDV